MTLNSATTTPSGLTAVISGTNGTATGTITDNDTPTVSVAPDTKTEGTQFHFVVTMTNPSSENTLVNYTLTPGTASASDYTDNSGGQITITAGNTTADILVTANDDSIWEPSEQFTVTLNSATTTPSGLVGTISGINGTAAGTITDNDTPSLVSIQSTSFTEGSGGGNQNQFLQIQNKDIVPVGADGYAKSNQSDFEKSHFPPLHSVRGFEQFHFCFVNDLFALIIANKFIVFYLFGVVVMPEVFRGAVPR